MDLKARLKAVTKELLSQQREPFAKAISHTKNTKTLTNIKPRCRQCEAIRKFFFG